MLGRDRCDLGLNAFPRAVLEQIGVGVRRHAGYLLSIAAARGFVGGAHQRNVADDGNEFIADVPVHDDIGVEGRCPVFQIGRAVPALTGGPDADEGGMKNGVVRSHVVGHEVMDEAGVKRPQFVHGGGRLMITHSRLHL
jgi:hypothetical protein